MGEDLSFFAFLKREFRVEGEDIRLYSPLTLAFVGDGVFDLIIRSIIVGRGNKSNEKLHYINSSMVKAPTQSAMIMALMDELSEEELEVYKRGRNAKTATSAKNATKADYHKATGLEALIGYLYLLGRDERIVQLIRLGMKRIEKEI